MISLAVTHLKSDRSNRWFVKHDHIKWSTSLTCPTTQSTCHVYSLFVFFFLNLDFSFLVLYKWFTTWLRCACSIKKTWFAKNRMSCNFFSPSKWFKKMPRLFWVVLKYHILSEKTLEQTLRISQKTSQGAALHENTHLYELRKKVSLKPFGLAF